MQLLIINRGRLVDESKNVVDHFTYSFEYCVSARVVKEYLSYMSDIDAGQIQLLYSGEVLPDTHMFLRNQIVHVVAGLDRRSSTIRQV
jgi:hypothetical protein